MEQSTAEAPKEETVTLPEQDGSVEDAANALKSLMGEESQDPTPQGQAESESPPKVETPPAPEEVKPAQLSVKIGERDYTIPIPEDMPEEVQQLVKDGLLMRADYSRKTQEVAEQRKAIEARTQQYDQVLQSVAQFPQHLAVISQVDAQLQQFQTHELWQRLAHEDPSGLRTVQAKQAYQDLLNQRQYLVGELGRAQQGVQTAQKQAIEERVQAALPKVKEHIPDFGPEKAREMRDFAKQFGATDADLDTLYDAPALVILNMAMQYHKLQTQTPVAQQKVEKLPPKVQRSGTKSDASSQVNQAAYHRLRSSGSTDDAAAVIKSLLG